jgi:hypothetical protein
LAPGSSRSFQPIAPFAGLVVRPEPAQFPQQLFPGLAALVLQADGHGGLARHAGFVQ